MKGIPLKTWEARAILDGCKPVTRQVLKPQPVDTDDCQHEMQTYDQMLPQFYKGDYSCVCRKCGYGMQPDGEGIFQPPYRPGSVLYVRETWRVQSARRFGADARIEFKSGGNMVKIQFPGCDDQYHSRREYDAFVARWADDRWHLSIHMPFEAARIFLRVTNVKVQHVQDITDEEARKEGYEDREDFHLVWNDRYADPRPVKAKGAIDHYESYPWEDIRETRTYRGRPWLVIGNPWVFVSELEQCEKPKEDA